MRIATMWFSVLQSPGCRIHALAASRCGSFYGISRISGKSNFKGLSCHSYSLEGGYSRKWIGRKIPIETGTSIFSCKTSNIKQEVSDVNISTNTTLDINKSEKSVFQRVQYRDIQQKIAENKDLSCLTTIIIFDIETTGLSRKKERIIEIALQDLLGGENSTFQTLVNPGCKVLNSKVHGISTNMVDRPDVPRMKDLIPILLQYVRSRQKRGGCVLLIAHNARCFDVPFLVNEFSRCSFEVPSDWLFVDTLPLAREVMKLGGPKLPLKLGGPKLSLKVGGPKVSSELVGPKVSPGTSLEALRQHYGIPLVGSAHRAMSDVNLLSLILQRMTFDLKLPVSGLVERSFRASDLTNIKKNSR